MTLVENNFCGGWGQNLGCSALKNEEDKGNGESVDNSSSWEGEFVLKIIFI